MDIHLLCLAIRRTRLDIPLDRMEYGYQSACGLHHCELATPLGMSKALADRPGQITRRRIDREG